ncbi:MAG: putative ABC transporter permease [Clostridiaceae bacterium]
MAIFSDFVFWFTLYSFMGWLMESTFASIKQRKYINRGFLKGYICPIYGFGALIIIQNSIVINSLFQNTTVRILVGLVSSILLVSILEYYTGTIFERIFHQKWWDYSTKKYNLKGYVCLQFSIVWGLLAFILINVVHPFVNSMTSNLNLYTKEMIALLFFMGLSFDTITTVSEIIKQNKTQVDERKNAIN